MWDNAGFRVGGSFLGEGLKPDEEGDSVKDWGDLYEEVAGFGEIEYGFTKEVWGSLDGDVKDWLTEEVAGFGEFEDGFTRADWGSLDEDVEDRLTEEEEDGLGFLGDDDDWELYKSAKNSLFSKSSRTSLLVRVLEDLLTEVRISELCITW